MMQRQQTIEALLNNSFKLTYFSVVNESHMHSVPPNSETHFKLTLVGDEFESCSRVQRHQKVYKLLGPMLQEGLHALALHIYTITEWAEKAEKAPASPDCIGGSKSG